MSHAASAPTPVFPSWLASPLGRIPASLHGNVFAHVLNRVLARQLADGELDFLRGRVLALQVRDARLDVRLSVGGSGFTSAAGLPHDVAIGGNVHDFLLLATRREDPDTLFFQRRLKMDGDTELGLYVKNLIDALDDDAVPALLRRALEGALHTYERLFGAR